jgi:hypothetical protein
VSFDLGLVIKRTLSLSVFLWTKSVVVSSQVLSQVMVNIRVSLAGIAHGLDANLRNGAVVDIRPPSRASSVQPMWFWEDVANGTGNAAVECIGAWIATAYGNIGSRVVQVPDLDAAGATANAALQNAVGFAAQIVPGPRVAGTAADWAPFVNQAATDASIRRRAIALGATRAAISGSYAITAADLLVNESVQTTTWTARGRSATGAPIAPDVTRGIPIVDITLSSRHTDVDGNLTFAEALGDAMDDLTDEEWSLVYAVYRMGLAAPPFAGVSLLECQHHYLTIRSNTVEGTEGQALTDEGEDVSRVFKDHEDEFRDVIWHKAAHPVRPDLLTELAIDNSMSSKLGKMNLGAAAIRVPYIEPELRAANAYLAVVKAISSWAKANGHRVELPALTAAVEATQRMPHRGTAVPYTGAPAMTRAEFVLTELVPRKSAAESVVAWAVGVARAMREDEVRRTRPLTALLAKSVLKLEREDIGSVGLGRGSYEDTKRFNRNQSERGKLRQIVMSDVATRANP